MELFLKLSLFILFFAALVPHHICSGYDVCSFPCTKPKVLTADSVAGVRPWFSKAPDEALKEMRNSTTRHVRYEGKMRKPFVTAVKRGVSQLQLHSAPSIENSLHLKGKPLIDFGTLGSLDLSDMKRYRNAIINAITKYGLTFSTSSQWIRHPLWIETTKRVEEVFGRPCILTRSTGIANMAFFSVIIRLDPDQTGGIIIDHDAHSSLRMMGVAIGGVEPSFTLKRTFDVEELEERMRELPQNAAPIWYVLDGMVSMTGKIPDAQKLFALQRKYPNLWVYCDDAHGTGWSGEGGKGLITDQVLHEASTNKMGYAEEANRWVFAVCFGKSLCADGGALIFPNEEMKHIVELFSPFSTFSCTKFPIADLALINEAMKMSQDGTIDELQVELKHKVEYMHESAHRHLEYLVDLCDDSTETPVLFIPFDRDLKTHYDIVDTLFQEGIFVANCVPPATRSLGIRVTVHRTAKLEDIDHLMKRIRDLLIQTRTT